MAKARTFPAPFRGKAVTTPTLTPYASLYATYPANVGQSLGYTKFKWTSRTYTPKRWTFGGLIPRG